MTHIHTDTR